MNVHDISIVELSWNSQLGVSMLMVLTDSYSWEDEKITEEKEDSRLETLMISESDQFGDYEWRFSLSDNVTVLR